MPTALRAVIELARCGQQVLSSAAAPKIKGIVIEGGQLVPRLDLMPLAAGLIGLNGGLRANLQVNLGN